MGKYQEMGKWSANVKAITPQQQTAESKTSFSPSRTMSNILIIKHYFLSMKMEAMVSHIERDKSISRR